MTRNNLSITSRFTTYITTRDQQQVYCQEERDKTNLLFLTPFVLGDVAAAAVVVVVVVVHVTVNH